MMTKDKNIFYQNLWQIKKCCIFAVRKNRVRDVAQPGSALRSGRRGRKFESCHPDKKVSWKADFFRLKITDKRTQSDDKSLLSFIYYLLSITTSISSNRNLSISSDNYSAHTPSNTMRKLLIMWRLSKIISWYFFFS